MRVTYEQFNTALVAALDAVSADRGAEPRYRSAVLAFAQSLGIEISNTSALTATPPVQAPPWVLRTWVDVRRGDVVRMPGQEATAAQVVELATLSRHVNDNPPAQLDGEDDDAYAIRVTAFQRDVQFHPERHAAEWTARPATLKTAAGDIHRIPNVNPDAPVEIHMTQIELDAIELLGGWTHRA